MNTYAKMKVYFVGLTLLFLTVLFFLAADVAPDQQHCLTSTSSIQYVFVTDEPFSEERLIAYLKELNFNHPHIVLAQARLETGNFTSKVFLENNNLFGMKKAYTRPTTAVTINRNHAVYTSWKQSVLDYALYTAYYVQGKTEREYYTYLSENYAEDPKYSVKVERVVKTGNIKSLFKL